MQKNTQIIIVSPPFQPLISVAHHIKHGYSVQTHQ